jgi:4-hydroxy-3-methylbut-2-enyl diphosphate reductase
MRPTDCLKVLLANPRGFCAGVERAVEIVERTLALYGSPVYVRHEIVHNKQVVQSLRERGAIFVDHISEIPEGAVTIFSAHGVSREVERDAARRGLDVIDATCPLVRKVHRHGKRYAEQGYDVVVIGHADHVEVEGTVGQISGAVHVISTMEDIDRIEVRDPSRVAFVTQTTLSVSDTREVIAALRRRFPAIEGPDTRDICYATHNRQMAVLDLARRAELLLVVGSSNSSNSNRLREVGKLAGVPSFLVEHPSMIDPTWLTGIGTVGVTAGASVPELLVQETIETMRSYRPLTVESLDGVVETVEFRLPERLSAAVVRGAA